MKFSGFALLAAGLAFVVHAYTPRSFDPKVSATTAYPDAAPAVSTPLPDKQPARTFSLEPGPVLKSLADRANVRQDRKQDIAVAEPAIEPAAIVVAAKLPQAVPAVDVTSPPPEIREPLKSVAPIDDTSRAVLVRNIKRELRRVGCYDGRIDAEWDSGVKTAVGTFMDRVNASLPYHRPDYVMLSLVRNHHATACGQTCPQGQSLSTEGRCMPNAIIARSMRKATPTVEAQAKKPAVTTPFTTTVTVAEVQPTAATVPATPKQPHVAHVKREPLPGRMAMGAPGSAGDDASPKRWWESLIGSPAPEPAKEQTLDRPVGLTHVPEPRPAHRPQPPPTVEVRQANLAIEAGTPAATTGSAHPGPTFNTGQTIERPRRARSSRSYSRRAARPRAQYARRWRGRNVQMMFQHPLGRM